MTLKSRVLILTATLVALTFFSCNRSVDKEEVKDSEPEFPGGYNAMQKYIQENLSWQEPKDTIESNQFVSFTVKANGEITDIEIITPLCESCDKATIQLVKGMPKWTPAQK